MLVYNLFILIQEKINGINCTIDINLNIGSTSSISVIEDSFSINNLLMWDNYYEYCTRKIFYDPSKYIDIEDLICNYCGYCNEKFSDAGDTIDNKVNISFMIGLHHKQVDFCKNNFPYLHSICVIKSYLKFIQLCDTKIIEFEEKPQALIEKVRSSFLPDISAIIAFFEVLKFYIDILDIPNSINSKTDFIGSLMTEKRTYENHTQLFRSIEINRSKNLIDFSQFTITEKIQLINLKAKNKSQFIDKIDNYFQIFAFKLNESILNTTHMVKSINAIKIEYGIQNSVGCSLQKTSCYCTNIMVDRYFVGSLVLWLSLGIELFLPDFLPAINVVYVNDSNQCALDSNNPYICRVSMINYSSINLKILEKLLEWNPSIIYPIQNHLSKQYTISFSVIYSNSNTINVVEYMSLLKKIIDSIEMMVLLLEIRFNNPDIYLSTEILNLFIFRSPNLRQIALTIKEPGCLNNINLIKLDATTIQQIEKMEIISVDKVFTELYKLTNLFTNLQILRLIVDLSGSFSKFTVPFLVKSIVLKIWIGNICEQQLKSFQTVLFCIQDVVYLTLELANQDLPVIHSNEIRLVEFKNLDEIRIIDGLFDYAQLYQSLKIFKPKNSVFLINNNINSETVDIDPKEKLIFEKIFFQLTPFFIKSIFKLHKIAYYRNLILYFGDLYANVTYYHIYNVDNRVENVYGGISQSNWKECISGLLRYGSIIIVCDNFKSTGYPDYLMVLNDLKDSFGDNLNRVEFYSPFNSDIKIIRNVFRGRFLSYKLTDKYYKKYYSYS